MSSIAKSSISLSKKDLTKSRVPPVGSRNVVFYHKATVGDLSINLLALIMPSFDMPNAVQAGIDELSGARLTVNKKNLSLQSSIKGQLIQNLDYIVVDSMTISLIGPYIGAGAEYEEIFVGTINCAAISDLVVASSKNVVRSYTLAIGQTTLNLAQEFKVAQYPSENIGIVKLFVNGVLAFRNTGNSNSILDRDYYEVDSGNGYGSTVVFNIAPVGIANEIIVDFGVQAITDFDAIGTIESLSGSVKKIADDLAVIAGTSANDYIMANPSDVERRGFGDTVLDHEVRLDVIETLPVATFVSSSSPQYTPTTSAMFYPLINNFVTLTVGSWIVAGAARFQNAGASPAYVNTYCIWASAPVLTETATPPSGAAIEAGSIYSIMPTFTSSPELIVPLQTVRITVTTSTNIYLVPQATIITPGNARIAVDIWAQKIK